MLSFFFTDNIVYYKEKAWYFQLKSDKEEKRALLNEFPQISMFKKLIVCWVLDYKHLYNSVTSSRNYEEKKDLRLYSFFPSYIEFYYYQDKIPLNYRTFNEVILGSWPQKPHFDLDLPREKCQSFSLLQKFEKELFQACFDVLQSFGVSNISSKDFCFYYSHGEEKYSTHLIINRYFHQDCFEAKTFYQLVREKLNSSSTGLVDCLDPAVYSKVQQFRILFSVKPRTQRIKLPAYWQECFSHKEALRYLRESLITFTADSCLLPFFSSPEQREQYEEVKTKYYYDFLPCERIISAMQEKIKEAPFVFQEFINGNILLLKRQAPSFCPVCERIHEKEHPYILLTVNYEAIWFCRRHPLNKGYPLCILTSEEAKLIITPEQKEISSELYEEENDNNCKDVFNELQVYNEKHGLIPLKNSNSIKKTLKRPENLQGHLLTLNWHSNKNNSVTNNSKKYLSQKTIKIPF